MKLDIDSLPLYNDLDETLLNSTTFMLTRRLPARPLNSIKCSGGKSNRALKCLSPLDEKTDGQQSPLSDKCYNFISKAQRRNWALVGDRLHSHNQDQSLGYFSERKQTQNNSILTNRVLVDR